MTGSGFEQRGTRPLRPPSIVGPPPVVAAVAVGAIAGAALRWLCDRLLGGIDAPVRPSLLVANVVGAALLGAVVAASSRLGPRSAAALGVGLCGGLTTMSGLALESAIAVDDGRTGDAVSMLATHVIGGIAAFIVARRVAVIALGGTIDDHPADSDGNRRLR